MKIQSPHLIFIFSLLLLLTASTQIRFTKTNLIRTPTSSSSDLISDGINNSNDFQLQPQSFLRFRQSVSETCEQSYGFLPCTTSVLGNLFLIIVYGYLMFRAARFLSTGSELLLELLGPGLVGGLLLPILGALPDALLILVSGLSGSKETAQDQVLVGMGLLAGSTVMLLTLLWGSCVLLGKTDINGSTTIDSQDTKGFHLTGSGISTDIWTSYAARIMVISLVPFVIVQLPQIIHTSSGRRLAVLISLIVSIALLVCYCLYQIFVPFVQKRKLAYVKHKHVISGILKYMKKRALGRLLTEDGKPNEDVIKRLFKSIDLNLDEYLAASELRALIVGIQFEEIDLDVDDAVQKVLQDFDTSNDLKISEEEFVTGIKRWLNEAKSSAKLVRGSGSGPNTMKLLDNFHLDTKQEYDLLLDDQSDEIVEDIVNAKWVYFEAVLLLLVGAVIAAAFADPLVGAVNNFSSATSIPSFFISFIALPLATNSSEAVSALIFAGRKKKRSSSLTFSEIYGAVTMNNVLCLAVFLAIVYVRQLTWDFSAEVLIILIVCMVMGLFASFRTLFPVWTCSIAYVLYPFSLALVYVLDYVFGWS